jgi:hypothetical protein
MRFQKSATWIRTSLILITLGPLSGIALGTSAAAAQAPSAQAPLGVVRAYLQAVDDQLLTRPAAATLSAFTLGSSTSSAPDAAMSRATVSYELAKAARFRAWAAWHRDTYTSVTSTLSGVKVTVSGRRATVTGRVVTTMLWSSSATTPRVALTPEKQASVAKAQTEGRVFATGQTVTSKVAAEHRFLMTKTSQGWKILSDAYYDPFEPGLAANHTTPLASPRLSGTVPVTSAVAAKQHPAVTAKETAVVPASYSYGYNRVAAAAYADKYWQNYNTTYPNCNPNGGDCANFVSQALWDPVTGANFPTEAPQWTPGNLTTCAATSEAWRYTPTQHSFFISNPKGSAYNFASLGAKGSASATRAYNISSMLIGDVIFDDWHSDGVIDHVTIAVKYASDKSTLIDAHNTDTYQVRWDFGYSDTTYYQDHFKNTITVP